MNKVIAISIILFAIPALGLAEGDEDQGPQGPQGIQGIQGVAGPTGPQGIPGAKGANGTNGSNGAIGQAGVVGAQGSAGVAGKNGAAGVNGTNGKDGKNGQDATPSWHGTDIVGGVAVRLYDHKYFQVQAFDDYTFGSAKGQDVLGDGRNTTIGARVLFKLGRSYEEKLIDAQALELRQLRGLVKQLMQ